MPADRAAHAECQAQLLRALLCGDGFPDGFDARKARAASAALLRKRARAAARRRANAGPVERLLRGAASRRRGRARQ